MGSKMKKLYPDQVEGQPNSSIIVNEYFVILNVCYQIGVFFSRSSLKFIKIKRVWFLTFLQMCNFVFMFLNAKYMYFESLYVVCPVLVFVGLMGGASYVNVLHGILELETLDKTEKESAMSLCMLFNDTGILCATTLSIILSNTVLKVN